MSTTDDAPQLLAANVNSAKLNEIAAHLRQECIHGEPDDLGAPCCFRIEWAAQLEAIAAQADSIGCTCSRLRVGGQLTGARNWNPDCERHGSTSAWYHSDAQVAARHADDERLRTLQRTARLARQHKVTHNHPGVEIELPGICPLCDLHHGLTAHGN